MTTLPSNITYWQHVNSMKPYFLDGWEKGRVEHDLRTGKMEVVEITEYFGEPCATLKNKSL